MHRFLALISALIALPALAQDRPPFTYADFLVTVHQHSKTPLPEVVRAPGVFCRISLGPYDVRVFAFSVEGEQRMVAFAQYRIDQLEILSQAPAR